MSFTSAVCVFVVTVSVLSLCVTQGLEYVLEVLVVLDKPSVERWEPEARQAGNTLDMEVRGLMLEVNTVYRALQAQGINISVSLTDDRVIYAQDNILCETNTNCPPFVDSLLSLHLFKKWLDSQAFTFDAALLITAYPFLDSNIGRAELGTVCQGGISVVAPYYDISQVQNIAHELGHVLGLDHDGETNSCPGSDGFVMRRRSSPLDRNAHTFSACSVEHLRVLLPSSQCLSPENTTAIRSPRFGQLVGADESCRRYTGLHVSRYYYYKGSYTRICESVVCEVSLEVISDAKFNVFGVPVRSPEGMQCESRHSCQEGHCVSDPTASPIWNKRCPFGDTPSPFSQQIQTCLDVKNQTKCDFLMWKDICCETCNM
ncbi:Zinc metalloproteinase/disintegrin [Plakobranchus ocellatus]|uniref:Zinc metalloproteinase/disintegrin n=1 Tax=Plakobranchus ocellatus TaxID=259542 RepID=A0AAV3Z3G6_9GAST|nr:Zinc metalloproteinase/disintegrin [Plakobranchus ocellatus]